MKILFFVFFLSFNIFAQKAKDESSALLSLGNEGLDKINDLEEKKKFLGTIDIEKQKIQDYVLKSIIDNAYELYQNGDYNGASNLAKKVLSIDPSSEEAKIISEASKDSDGKAGANVGKISMEDQLQKALSLYQQGEVLDAYRQMGAITRLSPNNVKAKYWYKKIEADLKDYYLIKGDEAYSANDKKTALTMYYKAMQYSPNDSSVLTKISQLEAEIRNDRVNEKLKRALDIYASGNLEESYKVLKEAISINPADERTNKLFYEMRSEIVDKYLAEGNELYKKKQYNSSIKSFTKALAYADSSTKIERMINNVKSTMKKEEERKKRIAEEKKKRDEERKKKKEEEAKQKEADQSSASNESTSSSTSAANQQSIITEQNKIAAQQHWQNGVKYLQSGDYQKAKDELLIAKKLDPGNSDVDAALKRIDQILGGGQ
jgi:tetratricopeptide (TPR) repeat protein